MIRVFHPQGVAVLAALPGIFVSLDQAPLVAFMANEKLAQAYENVPQVEILMLMSACSIGATMSSLFSGRICSFLGPLDTMRIASLFWCMGCIGTFCGSSNLQVVLWKLAKGVGLGLLSVSSYLYIFEVLCSADRAVSVAWRVLFSVLAQEMLYGVSLLLRPHIGPAAAFHYTWIAEAFWGVLLICSTFFLPQSPKVLLQRGKWGSAKATHDKLMHVSRNHSTRSRMSQKSHASQKSRASRVTEATRVALVRKGKDSPESLPDPPVANGCKRQRSPMQGWLQAILGMQLAQVLCVAMSPLFFQYLGSFCQLSTASVETWFHAQYALQIVFLAVPLFLLKTAKRSLTVALGSSLLAAAYVTLSVVSFVYTRNSGLDPRPYQLLHIVGAFPASSILAMASFAVSVYASLISATLLIYCAESLGLASRYKGLSVATSTSFALGALLNGFLLYFHAVRPSIIFSVLSAVCIVLCVFFLYASDTLEPSMQEEIPYPLPLSPESNELEEIPQDDQGKCDEENPEPIPTDLSEVSGDEYINPYASDISIPLDHHLPTPFRPQDHTQNFIRINKRAFQNKPSAAKTEGTLATAKSQFTDAPLVTAMTRLPDDRVSLELSRSPSSSTERKESRGTFTAMWTNDF